MDDLVEVLGHAQAAAEIIVVEVLQNLLEELDGSLDLEFGHVGGSHNRMICEVLKV